MAGKTRQKLVKGATHKRCPKCGEVKPLSDFHRHIGHSDGHASRCIPCRQEDKKIYYQANREHDNEKSRQWRIKNPDKVAEKNRKDYKKHPSHHIARTAVNYAVKNGKLPRVTTLMCSVCGKNQAIHYHHHLGYSRKHRLDVIPVCQDCHKD